MKKVFALALALILCYGCRCFNEICDRYIETDYHVFQELINDTLYTTIKANIHDTQLSSPSKPLAPERGVDFESIKCNGVEIPDIPNVTGSDPNCPGCYQLELVNNSLRTFTFEYIDGKGDYYEHKIKIDTVDFPSSFDTISLSALPLYIDWQGVDLTEEYERIAFSIGNFSFSYLDDGRPRSIEVDTIPFPKDTLVKVSLQRNRSLMELDESSKHNRGVASSTYTTSKFVYIKE